MVFIRIKTSTKGIIKNVEYTEKCKHKKLEYINNQLDWEREANSFLSLSLTAIRELTAFSNSKHSLVFKNKSLLSLLISNKLFFSLTLLCICCCCRWAMIPFRESILSLMMGDWKTDSPAISMEVSQLTSMIRLTTGFPSGPIVPLPSRLTRLDIFLEIHTNIKFIKDPP